MAEAIFEGLSAFVIVLETFEARCFFEHSVAMTIGRMPNTAQGD